METINLEVTPETFVQRLKKMGIEVQNRKSNSDIIVGSMQSANDAGDAVAYLFQPKVYNVRKPLSTFNSNCIIDRLAKFGNDKVVKSLKQPRAEEFRELLNACKVKIILPDTSPDKFTDREMTIAGTVEGKKLYAHVNVQTGRTMYQFWK